MSFRNVNWKLGSVMNINKQFIMPWLGEDAFEWSFRRPALTSLFKWILCRRPPVRPPAETFTVLKPKIGETAMGAEENIRVTWIGHASCAVEMSGLLILTDPIFSNSCAPTQWTGPRRIVAAACSIADLGRVDLVLISHNHYDHLDYDSVMEIESRYHPVFVGGIGLAKWFIDTAGIAPDRVIEMDWWEEKTLFNDRLSLQFLPTQHWSKRHIWGDERESLWGAFAVKNQFAKFFFNGDTGYNVELYEEIGRRIGPVDIAAIPIGAYEPRKIMQAQHVNPEEAAMIHQHLSARLSIAIHHQTFILTDEPLMEPSERLAAASLDLVNPFICVKHGQTVRFNSIHKTHELLQ